MAEQAEQAERSGQAGQAGEAPGVKTFAEMMEEEAGQREARRVRQFAHQFIRESAAVAAGVIDLPVLLTEFALMVNEDQTRRLQAIDVLELRRAATAPISPIVFDACAIPPEDLEKMAVQLSAEPVRFTGRAMPGMVEYAPALTVSMSPAEKLGLLLSGITLTTNEAARVIELVRRATKPRPEPEPSKPEPSKESDQE